MNEKQIRALVNTEITIVKYGFIGCLLLGVVATVTAAFVPNTPRSKFPRGGGRYL